MAYGLGVQGLGKGGLSTNLLPPEIERVRLIRAKKPWALAASALVMLGLSSLFMLGDYRAAGQGHHARSSRRPSTQAKSVSKRGAEHQDRLREGQGRRGTASSARARR